MTGAVLRTLLASIGEGDILLADCAYDSGALRTTQAALGSEVEVPATDGSKVCAKIPAGAQTGEQFRLRGKGFSVLRSAARGDMHIQVAVETSQHLTRRQRELLEEFEAESRGNSKGSPESEGFFAKVKEFFEGGVRVKTRSRTGASGPQPDLLSCHHEVSLWP
jgi:hypothetical protein